MLSERYMELLTAYVDGEISTRQRKMLLRMLRRSPEARELLRKLQGDSRDVIHLPRQKLDSGFSLQVMETIAERGINPTRRSARVSGPRLSTWAGWAAAAAVLICVGAASYLASPLFLKNERHKNGALAAREENGVEPPKAPKTDRRDSVVVRRDAQPVDKTPRDGRVPHPEVNHKKDGADKKSTVQVADNKTKPVTKKVEPEPDDKFLLGFPTASDLPRVSDPNLSVMLPLQEIEQKKNKDKLLAKLKKDDAFHVQMLCRDTAKGLERLRVVLAANKIQLVIDQPVLARLKNPKMKTTFVVYAENLRPEELVGILEQLGRGDRKAAAPKAPEQFGYVVVNTMSPKFRQQISKFLGLVPPRSSPGKSKAPLGVDVRKPLEDGTAADVERALKERELARSKVKPEAGKPVRQVLVLAYNEDKSPARPRAAQSKEVKQFRESLTARQAGTLQVVLVLVRDNV